MNTPTATDYNDPEVLERVALDTLELGTRGGGEIEVSVSAGEGFSVTVRGGTCETIEYERDKALAVTVYLDGRKGNATTSDFSAPALRETVDAARLIAEHGERDEYAGLPAAEYLCSDVPDLDLDHPWAIDANQAIALAIGMERAALASDKRLRQSDGASVNRYRGVRAMANSHGFHGAYRGTRHGVSAVMITVDDGGAMQRGYWYTSGRDASRFEDIDAIGQRAAESYRGQNRGKKTRHHQSAGAARTTPRGGAHRPPGRGYLPAPRSIGARPGCSTRSARWCCHRR